MGGVFTLVFIVGGIIAYYAWKEYSKEDKPVQPFPSGPDTNKKSGYLALYGLWDWYDSQSKEVQDYLYKSCGYGIGTDSRNLIEGDIEVLNSPDEEYPWTATKFLCQHAINAAHDRNHSVCNILMDSAFKRANSTKDSIYYGIILQKIQSDLQILPDQNEVNKYKPKVLSLIKTAPGILQMEVKKHFPAELENVVGYALSQLNQAGKIRREKKGQSFQLWVVEEL